MIKRQPLRKAKSLFIKATRKNLFHFCRTFLCVYAVSCGFSIEKNLSKKSQKTLDFHAYVWYNLITVKEINTPN
uniref:Uncharacterized protein n=1 Tax=Caudovirales sp. ct1Jx6 TaxID=2826765 RepID=A0A8S5MMB5_9CAUD|nr:MAG TPA: hypothetical protein [Caudovirales sp. ct1Jx6]